MTGLKHEQVFLWDKCFCSQYLGLRSELLPSFFLYDKSPCNISKRQSWHTYRDSISESVT